MNKIKIVRMENLELVSTTEILNAISECYGNNLLDKMVDFCETNDVNPKLLGDILEEDKVFKTLLYQDCVNNNYIKDIIIEDKKDSMQTLDVW